MAGIESKFEGIDCYKGPFVRTAVEIPVPDRKYGKTGVRKIVIIDVYTPALNKTSKKNK